MTTVCAAAPLRAANHGSCDGDEARWFVSNEYFTFGRPDDFTVAIKLADFDGDGDRDGVMINGRHWARQDYVLLNNGVGRFLTALPLGKTLTTGYEPAIADLDNDGSFDIATARDRIESQIFLNDGEGGFRDAGPYGVAGPARSVAAADLDRDGHMDLIVSQRSGVNYVVYGSASGFGDPVFFGPSAQTVRVAVGDLNDDGRLDAAFATLDEGGSFIAFNDGEGRLDKFMTVGADLAPSVDVAVADLNNDGFDDLVFASIKANAIYFNDGDGGFASKHEFGLENERSYGLVVADLNSDTRPDIAVANDGQSNAVYLNCPGGFVRIELVEDPKARSYGVSAGDLNGDGSVDLVFVNSGSMSRVHLNVAETEIDAALGR